MGCFGSFFRVGVLSLSTLAPSAFAATVVKVDFDMSGRNSSEVTEPNYVPWVVSGAASKDTTLNGVKITVDDFVVEDFDLLDKKPEEA